MNNNLTSNIQNYFISSFNEANFRCYEFKLRRTKNKM